MPSEDQCPHSKNEFERPIGVPIGRTNLNFGPNETKRKTTMADENTAGAVPEWVLAAGAHALASEDAMRFTHGGKCIAVYNLSGSFYATSGICTHEHAFMSEGYIDGETVECPLHQGLFNIRTGAALSPPVTKNLQTFKTKVENGQVYVLVE